MKKFSALPGAVLALGVLAAGLLIATVPASATPSASTSQPDPVSFRKVITIAHGPDSEAVVEVPVDATGAASTMVTTDVDTGCPSGYACLYTDNTDILGPTHPHTNYYYYGYDNFSNVTGNHYIVNNQTGGARVYLCTGYNGTNCTTPNPPFYTPGYGNLNYIKAGYFTNYNFTPINSMVLCAGAGSCP